MHPGSPPTASFQSNTYKTHQARSPLAHPEGAATERASTGTSRLCGTSLSENYMHERTATQPKYHPSATH